MITCPKCNSSIETDESMLYDEFVYNSERCDVCNSDIVYNSNGIVLFTSVHEPIAVAVDVVIANSKKEILLVTRKYPPCQGKLALPGGFIGSFEDAKTAAIREVLEETSLQLDINKLVLLCTMTNPGRDPRGRVISIVYVYTLAVDELPAAADDASNVAFYNIFSSEFNNAKLAFDHSDIIKLFR